MIRVAFLEYEKETKDIVFILSKMFMNVDWTFRHYTKASELLKAMKEEEYNVFVFDEIFKTNRMESVFVHDNPNAIFIYVCVNPIVVKKDDQRGRIFYIEKDKLNVRLNEIRDAITSQASQKELYALSYDGIKVNLPYEEIYYLEKSEKMVYFHTKKGIFHQRINMSNLEDVFTPYGFIRTHVSYLVNEKHIVAWYKDEVELITSKKIPLSRAQKKKILANQA
ncbi:MAG: LytTR family transcriptional regulator [Holdemanella sp.]|nr:LytTR family transcriptional regulator [Holdemanella sp.]